MATTAKADMPTKRNTTLRALRLRAGLTQFELAHRARVSLTTVVVAERGGSVSRGSWALIALALGVHPNKLQP